MGKRLGLAAERSQTWWEGLGLHRESNKMEGQGEGVEPRDQAVVEKCRGKSLDYHNRVRLGKKSFKTKGGGLF